MRSIQTLVYSLHLLITAAKRIISGLVPQPIITFVLPLFFHLKSCSTISILPVRSYFLLPLSTTSPASILLHFSIRFSPFTIAPRQICTPSSSIHPWSTMAPRLIIQPRLITTSVLTIACGRITVP